MRVLRVNLLLAGCLGALALAAPPHAAPISAHAMVHSCCTPEPLKERIFSEASALGADYIRVDVELSGIFASPNANPDWSGLDSIIELSQRHRVRILGLLLAPPDEADEEDFGRMAGEVAEHAAGSIDHWEIVNEPDGEWAFDGTAEEYALMLSSAYAEIKGRVPEAKVLFGGLMRPHEPAWVERVFATPGADALHKFDIASIHLRGVPGSYRTRNTRCPSAPAGGPWRWSFSRPRRGWRARSGSSRDWSSFQIFHLFAYPLEVFLDGQHLGSDRRVIGLAAGRVGLPEELLKEKPQPLAYPVRRRHVEGRPERRDVRGESRDLLGHVEPVGQHRDLLGDPALVG